VTPTGLLTGEEDGMFDIEQLGDFSGDGHCQRGGREQRDFATRCCRMVVKQSQTEGRSCINTSLEIR